jgi:hypothetical protein
LLLHTPLLRLVPSQPLVLPPAQDTFLLILEEGSCSEVSKPLIKNKALIFTRVNSVSTTNGDITSLLYNSVEYQDSSKFTQIASGLGSATVTSKVSGNYATISIVTDTLVSSHQYQVNQFFDITPIPTKTQTYVAVSGQSAIYVGTYTTAEPTVGELRFIARLAKSKVPNGYTQSEIDGMLTHYLARVSTNINRC